MMPAKKPLPAPDLRHVLEHAGDAFRELDGARIFVTGGTGFFGIWLLESLAHAVAALGLSIKVTALSRDPRRVSDSLPHLAGLDWLQFHEGDIRTFDDPEGGFTHCIHGATAASAALSRDEPLTMFDTCLQGTRRALEFAARSGVKRFLFTSSGAIHGPQPPSMTHVPEDWQGGPDPLSAASCYAEGKRAAEHLCSLFAGNSGLHPVIARCWAFMGPHLPLDTHFAAGNFLGNALSGSPIRITGDGTAERSYLYAADLAVWLWTLLAKGPALRPVNVGSGHAVSIRTLAEAVAESVSPPLPVHIAGTALPGKPPARYVPDVSRAAAEMGLTERIPLRDSIRRTLDWLRS